MSKTISINAGSSSLKWQLYKMPEEEVIAKGLIERIGLEDGVSTVKFNGQTETETTDIPNHTIAVKILLEDLLRLNIITSYDEITGVGHRVVAGGEIFKESALIGEKEIQEIEDLSPLAPLHNPAHVAAMRAFQEVLPEVTNVAVFDTAFHTTMPAVAYRYPIANKYYDNYQVRKYGAHGTSHQYVAHEAAKLLGKPIEDTKIITCHIGNGASITAVKGGKSVDTSMGLTPLGGIMMGTRSGDLDPAILEFLCNHENLTISEMLNILNKKSGVLGMSGGISSDFRDLNAAANDGNEIAKVTLEAYAYRVAKYIGAYTAAMNGVDAITFTAGVGENAAWLRPMVAKYLGYLGVELDEAASEKACGVEGIISTPESKVKLCVIPTNEELAIARETLALVK